MKKRIRSITVYQRREAIHYSVPRYATITTHVLSRHADKISNAVINTLVRAHQHAPALQILLHIPYTIFAEVEDGGRQCCISTTCRKSIVEVL